MGLKRKRILKLRQLRRERELTQRQMASRVGMHINAYCQVERGNVSPNLKTAFKIAGVLGRPIEEVFRVIEVAA